ncbi:DNA-directed RNA polymerase subunit omega [Cerasibacillus terrae]|uniref:DNA-directed RNA polymerase subunit omega n=1 Tax=Cerasibacillus terrae TaxID=2498845 RepID=A0A5C8P214_9BACI|nr:DNA-directed RNA polymerase subunit omega [Cerasibacillus terrae]TXL67630.1 DNA-directed RNA polymerase subunit omega [Cerasibacillus terrae]
MLYPSIDSLLEKINTKYSLVTFSARRARQLKELDNLQIENPKSYKMVGKALEEIDAGKITLKEDV